MKRLIYSFWIPDRVRDDDMTNMKIKLLLLISLSVFLFGHIVRAEEKINDYQVSVHVNTDASMNVDEAIIYDFDQSIDKHGIYRYIPIKYSREGSNYSMVISDISVDDGNNPLIFEQTKDGNNLRIKIGEASTVSGVRLYNIHYRVERAINYFKDHDEIYWNATGNNWSVGITQVAYKIYFPKEIEQGNINSQCFSGATGSQKECLSQRYIFSGQNKVQSAVFIGEMYLPGEGLTAVVSLPKGLIKEPSIFKKISNFLLDNGGLLLPFIVVGLSLALWFKRGRDPRGQGVIIAQYDAPDKLTPTEVGTIVDERADNADISADIINLAIKGYIKINRIEKDGLILKSSDYQLDKIKDENDLPNEFEKILMRGLFVDGNSQVKISDLKEKFYKELKKIKEEVYISVTKKGYFVANPQKTRNWYITFGTLIMFLGALLANYSASLMVGIFISGVVMVIFGYFMPRKTEMGVAAYEHILGLKDYLSVAEKDRLEFHNAPEKNPEIFEKLLPFAMVLGVEEKWAKQFEGIYNGRPAWYNDPTNNNFSSIVFVHSLNSFSTASNSSLAAMPNSGAGGGVSGFGGGGFSGGGFGGGGGGSW